MRPLTSLKILDFSTLLPGPYASMLLADMGADVLRVESPTRVDMTTLSPPIVDGVSAAHHQLNRNKRSVALDLKTDAGRDAVIALLADYDIVLEQFRPGVMARLGLDYDTLKAVRPDLIYCSITGYGQSGPYRDRAGHDINYLAMSGVASYTGRQASGPIPPGIQIADVAGGSHHAVMGILAAVVQRQATGEGQHVDISMTDAAFALNTLAGPAALAGAALPIFENGLLNGGSFYDFYETQDGRYLSVGGLEPAFIQNLARVLDEPRLLNIVNLYDASVQSEMRALLKDIFLTRSFDDWCAVFETEDCCVEPVLDILEAADHPHLKARGATLRYETESGEAITQLACPIKFSGSEQAPPKAAPKVGRDQHILDKFKGA